MTRKEKKDFYDKRRAERAAEKAAKAERAQVEFERKRAADDAEDTGHGLLRLGCPLSTQAPATSLDEELEAARDWHRLLELGPVAEGTTLLSEIRRLWNRYVSRGCPLYNPWSGQMSRNWAHDSASSLFEEDYNLPEGAADLVLDPEDFNDPSSGTAATVKSPEAESEEQKTQRLIAEHQKQIDDLRRKNPPPATFTASGGIKQ
jgi:hypothetical protein